MRIIIDADAHVSEARDVFTDRLPSKYGDAIPHMKYRDDVKQDWWFVGDTPVEKAVGSAFKIGEDGKPFRGSDSHFSGNLYSEMHPSSYNPNERVKVMDEQGVQAATTYPWLGLTGPDVWDSALKSSTVEFQMEVVAAYNDWIGWWGTEQPGRFIPLGCLPYWDVPGAVREIERCAELGSIQGMVMSGWPQNHGQPYLADRHWDPMWAAAEAAGFSISFHAGGGGNEDSGASPERRRLIGGPQTAVLGIATECLKNALSSIDILTSGVLNRYPKLNFVLAESGVGWMNFVLDVLDHHYKRYTPWKSNDMFSADLLPSDLFRRQVFVMSWFEDVTLDMPLENLMFETDYPHPTALFGAEVEQSVQDHLNLLSPDQLEDVLWRNALRCFVLEPEDVGIDSNTLALSR